MNVDTHADERLRLRVRRQLEECCRLDTEGVIWILETQRKPADWPAAEAGNVMAAVAAQRGNLSPAPGQRRLMPQLQAALAVPLIPNENRPLWRSSPWSRDARAQREVHHPISARSGLGRTWKLVRPGFTDRLEVWQ